MRKKNLNFKLLVRSWCLMFEIFLLLAVWHPVASAKTQSLGLSIYPPLLEVTIMPGKTITQVYKLSNEGNTDLVMTSTIVGFEPSDEKGGIRLLPAEESANISPENSYLSWFSFLNANLKLGENFSLPAGRTQEIILKIKVPDETLEKDYYATLIFQTTSRDKIEGLSLTKTQAKIGSNILISVSKTGQLIKKAEITEFSAPKIIDSFDQPKFLVKIKNIGHSFFKPLGKITLSGWLEQKETLDLLPQNILGNSSRIIQCQIDNEGGPCQVKSRFLFGPLKAKLTFGLDDFSEEYQKEIYFIALPIKLILAILSVFVILRLIKFQKSPKE